ncbi:helix-turn-helix domain-containing protein [Spiractinospora alimapuensis]|nr:helix-turn-helix domain-containing protein [Spiractinospora alimapuensis]
MPGARLSATERAQIAEGLGRRESYAVIAQRLGQPTSTVSREVGRNGGRSGAPPLPPVGQRVSVHAGGAHRAACHGRPLPPPPWH